jgi:hypothetical protein
MFVLAPPTPIFLETQSELLAKYLQVAKTTLKMHKYLNVPQVPSKYQQNLSRPSFSRPVPIPQLEVSNEWNVLAVDFLAISISSLLYFQNYSGHCLLEKRRAGA